MVMQLSHRPLLHISSSRIIFKILLLQLIVFLTFLAVPAKSTGASPGKKLLIINSYHKGLSWTDSVMQGIENEFDEDGIDVEVYSEYMDSKRYQGKDYFLRLYETYRLKFINHAFDVVIVSDNDALNFALEHHEELFPDTPVVFCGINNFHESMLESKDFFTGVVEEIDIKGTLELALSLHPDVTKVVSINDDTTTGIAVRSEVQAIAPLFAGRVDIEFIEDFSIAELKERVWKLPRSSLILLSVANRDRTGRFIDYEESISHIYSESSVPIYSLWDTYLGNGIVGGRLTNGYHQGKTAALMALRIMKGESVESIPVVKDSPNKYMFDYRQLKLFGISESELPEESIIINEPDTLYSRHKVFILSGIFAIISLVVVIVVLLTLISYRKKMEEALRDSEERYRDLYENAPDMYHSLDKDGIVLYCNETEARMLGYRKDEIIGKHISNFFSERTKKLFVEEFPKLKERSVHLDVEREFVRKDGSTFTASLNISTEVDDDGELIKTKAIARDLTERRRVEELKKSQEQLRSLSAHLESAREKEKKRIARQIHDELGHALTTLSLDLSWLNNRLSNRSETLDTELIMDRTHAMSDLIESTVQTVQRISSELIPGVLDHLGLAEAIKWQTDKFRERTGMKYNVIIASDTIMLDQQSSVAVFRIFQETLTNIARHAKAAEVTVTLKEEDDTMTLEINDNGIGIQESQISSPESVGLIGIRERARILGGRASISGSPTGTTVKLVIPINDHQEDE